MKKKVMEDASRRSLVKEEEKEAADSSSKSYPDSDFSRASEDVAKVESKKPDDEDEDEDEDEDDDGTKEPTSHPRKEQIPIRSIDTERVSMEPGSIASSLRRKEQDDQLESAKAAMVEVREENKRLKTRLNQITRDYQNLQMQFYNIVHQEEKKSAEKGDNDHCREVEEPELISLTLGRSAIDSKKDEKNKTSNEGKGKEGLTLGLDCKFDVSKSDVENEVSLPNQSPTNSSEDPKEEAVETWPPSKILKTMRNGDDEVLQQNPIKKTRVCVRARCDTPTMNDGCQWRKYGQKIAKGNPCPRAYYRCTVAPSCPVRKQVQRCAEDMSILITTYEGTHNHPLPMSATAMASTTAAAASMLLSGSLSNSQPGSSNPTTSTSAYNLHGLNYYLSDNMNSKLSNKFYLPNSSFSTTPSHPTIILDLTSPPSSSSSLLNRFSSPFSSAPRYPSISLNFSSSESNTLSWNNGLLNYGSSTTTSQPYLKSQIGTNAYQSLMQKNNNQVYPPQQSLSSDAIEAATKAITADPSFQSALAAALTSIIGTGSNTTAGATQAAEDNLGQKSKCGEPLPVASSTISLAVKGNGRESSFLNKSTSSSSQSGSLMFHLPPSLPFSSPKGAPTSSSDARNHSG
ncbi:hypothetical protein SLEP1_g25017 [Rubroshorea leprosula]|uniref:WRKY domain-containing protein n=1 Tax=Rubroshorea leprosula TaxID=152421 RepID=A0AAV5JNQ9_9ROSI|nr:hypothetical protein SLEP1_g25017 [Rubroshorea leprosula]